MIKRLSIISHIINSNKMMIKKFVSRKKEIKSIMSNYKVSMMKL
jgi:peptidoglycan hydrolase CwlO-like protein